MKSNSHNVRMLLVLVALPLVFGGRSVASDRELDEGKQLLDTFLNDVTTLAATFEQSLIDADDTVVEESNGTLEIQRPGRFRWTYDRPYEQIMVADGLNIWNYDVDLAQVTVKNQAEVLGSTREVAALAEEDPQRTVCVGVVGLDAQRLNALAWHIVPVTILAVLLAVFGAGIRMGGYF